MERYLLKRQWCLVKQTISSSLSLNVSGLGLKNKILAVIERFANHGPIKNIIDKIFNILSKTNLPYFFAFIIVSVITFTGFALHPHVNTSNLIMLYLLGVVVSTGSGQRRGPAIFAALLSTLAFDFFFVPPYFSFAVSDIQYFFTLIVMLFVTQIITHLTIHSRKHAEATRRAQMQAETERFRNTLLSSISHDLRTPLAAIMGSASSLLEPGKSLTIEMKQELAQNIYDESERLTHLVNNILQTVRLESRSFDLAKQLSSVEELIGSALNRLEKSVGNRPITINLPQPTPLVRLDPILIEQVLINLIQNIIKFSPPNTPIEISAVIHRKNILFKIADRGPGIDPKEFETIFDKFYQGKKKANSGVGLGLAICKDIIKMHGGEIWAENRNNGGARFNFTLPLG